jgi:hypothetical protein
MFFAYNNGLTATAESIAMDPSGTRIESVQNFQIVNGGQTTASIFTSRKKHDADLSRVHVQVKLSIIPPEQVNEVVPRISEYANTQNKVSAADFFSNHPFHLRIEDLSRRLWAPSPEGGLRETHWFYERARGQYANAQANLTPARKKEFLLINPRHQQFTKTDLAKFENSMNMLPQVVSLGAQKNFAHFASEIGKAWERNDGQFNELYFKRLIAKAIIFRYLDKNIMKQTWYGGYKANIVTYSIAKLQHMITAKRKGLDLEKIWLTQKLSVGLEKQLLAIAQEVNMAIQDTPDWVTNVTEYCKKNDCWNKVEALPISLSGKVEQELLDLEEREERERYAEKVQKIDSGIEAQKYVIEKEAAFWKKVAAFGHEKSLLSPKEIGIITIACEMPSKIPTEKQSKILIDIEKHLMQEGYFDGNQQDRDPIQ